MLYTSNIVLEIFNSMLEIICGRKRVLANQSKWVVREGGLVAIGIMFDGIIGYSFMGAGMLLSILSALKIKSELNNRG